MLHTHMNTRTHTCAHTHTRVHLHGPRPHPCRPAAPLWNGPHWPRLGQRHSVVASRLLPPRACVLPALCDPGEEDQGREHLRDLAAACFTPHFPSWPPRCRASTHPVAHAGPTVSLRKGFLKSVLLRVLHVSPLSPFTSPSPPAP